MSEAYRLVPLEPNEVRQFKADMQEAFTKGAEEGGFVLDEEVPAEEGADKADEEILPEEDIDRSLGSKGALALKAVTAEGEMVGGAVVVINGDHGHLDFLYVKHSMQNKGLGKFMWFEIERQHPEVRVWELCTPFYEKRNIHFYLNVCGFVAYEFNHPRHPDTTMPQRAAIREMLKFRKVIPPPSA